MICHVDCMRYPLYFMRSKRLFSIFFLLFWFGFGEHFSISAKPNSVPDRLVQTKDLMLGLVARESAATGFSLFDLTALNQSDQDLSVEAVVIFEWNGSSGVGNRTQKRCPIFVELQAGQQSRYPVPCRATGFLTHELKIVKVYSFRLSKL